MTKYGQRYLTSDEFVSYCSKLNIKLLPNQELELYEREKALCPVAYIILPEEYLTERKIVNQNPETYGRKLAEWDEIERMFYGQSSLVSNSNFDLWHQIDREFEKGNKYLLKSNIDRFEGKKLQKRNVKKYYHYYQVHQVCAIQKKYPVFAKHYWLLGSLQDDAKNKISYLLPLKEDKVASLYGQSLLFNALSFYIELNSNEREKTFELLPEINGVKTLNDHQFEGYVNRVKGQANFVFQKFGLTDDHYYQFLLYLLELHSEYERDERIRLADELMADIRYAIDFFTNARGISKIDIENEVKRRNPTKTKKFRHVDAALEIYDYARETFERLANAYNNKFPKFAISNTDIGKLLDFIEEKRLFIVPHAIFDIDETLNTERAFRTNSLYVGLTNLSIGLECFLRELANEANQVGNAKIKVDTLHPIIKDMFSWGDKFANEHEARKKIYKNNTFLYLEDVYNSPDIDEAVRIFLIAYQSRNFVAHNYTLDQHLYNNWYSKIYVAVCEVFFYSWIYATNKKWL